MPLALEQSNGSVDAVLQTESTLHFGWTVHQISKAKHLMREIIPAYVTDANGCQRSRTGVGINL